jgi:predicted flap endonuclease-1-like 5' DNA nuclease
MKEKFEKQVSSNKLVKKAEKMSEKLKKNISSTIDEAKEKLEDYAEDALDSINEKLDKKAPQKAKKTKKATKKEVVKKEEITAEKEVIIADQAEEAQPKAAIILETIQVPKTDVKDDLKVIKGVGPVLEKSLNDLNITAYDQIAKMTIEDLTNLLNGAGINAKIYDLADWKAQATLALAGDMEAVKNWEKK